jgi:hypothetical protein
MKEHIKALRKRFGPDTVNRALNFESGDGSNLAEVDKNTGLVLVVVIFSLTAPF